MFLPYLFIYFEGLRQLLIQQMAPLTNKQTRYTLILNYLPWYNTSTSVDIAESFKTTSSLPHTLKKHKWKNPLKQYFLLEMQSKKETSYPVKVYVPSTAAAWPNYFRKQ